MTNLVYERLHENLVKLKLNTVGTILDNYLEIAAKEGKTTLEVLDYLMDQEKHAKDASSQETRMKLARFPVKKRLEDFDFEFQPSIDKAVVYDLASLRFVHNAENVVFLGPPGVGKSHLAVALGIEAVKTGLSVYFANAGILIDLNSSHFPPTFLGENFFNCKKSQYRACFFLQFLSFSSTYLVGLLPPTMEIIKRGY